MPDALVQSAVHHWAPRFVANGVPLTDFEEVTARLESWDEWCEAWSQCAAMHEGIGRTALIAGYQRSAAQHLTTAAVCYHFAKFVYVRDVKQMRAAHMKAVECRKLALPHLNRPANTCAFRSRTAPLPPSCGARLAWPVHPSW